MLRLIYTFLILGMQIGLSAVQHDLMPVVPGYPQDPHTHVYSGYLSTKSTTRSLHYVFVESAQGTNNSDPVLLWMNGGPGCSSMLGFLQQIGPFYLEDGVSYADGDLLTENPYSWHQKANLLFIQSPAVVGFSYNANDSKEQPYIYTDANTADDNLMALMDFLLVKYDQYRDNQLWIAGQSYAGKYIPDLAARIDKHNSQAGKHQQIALKGLLINNGAMNFAHSQQKKSKAEFMARHSFIDPDVDQYWMHACASDEESAGCQFYHKVVDRNIRWLNLYGVYADCYYDQDEDENGVPCIFMGGVKSYFNSDINKKAFHVAKQQWDGPCVGDINYDVDLDGSMSAYQHLLMQRQPGANASKYRILLYNGDWDRVIPYVDTLKNIRALGQTQISEYIPWFTDRQHSGFIQHFTNGLTFATVKGATHQVTQTKRKQAYALLSRALSGQLFTFGLQDRH